ncbi:MAG TPA: hypothetical protein VM262_17230 [Acidimicrobiales bacterium]|nr:hypothetical protein [Acidimicrobiales bacterium]
MTGGLAFLLLVVAITVVGLVVLWVRNRDGSSLDSGVEEFQREMRALSPDPHDDDHGPR